MNKKSNNKTPEENFKNISIKKIYEIIKLQIQKIQKCKQ